MSQIKMKSIYKVKVCVKPNLHKPVDSTVLENNFTFSELKFVMKCITRDTAPGIDGICYSMLKNLPNKALCNLLKIYNDVWNGLVPIPDGWKK